MKLTIARHGQTIENVNGIVQGHSHGTLTTTGHEQAKALAKSLKNRDFDYIFSSDLKRCTDTSDYIRKFHPDTPYKTTEALREYSFGKFHGIPSNQIDWSKIPGDMYNSKPGGGESLLEGRDRVLAFLQKIYSEHPNDRILFITHGGPIRVIRQYVNHRPFNELREFEMDNCAVFEFEINAPIEYERVPAELKADEIQYIKSEYSREQAAAIPALTDEIVPGTLRPLTEGHFSQAFKFETPQGEERVLRLGRKLYSFEADQYAHDHFAAPDLPIPKVYEIGEAEQGLYYCVSEFAPGTPSDQMPPEDFERAKPEIEKAFASVFAKDISGTSGEGDIDTKTGDGVNASFAQALKSERASENLDELRRQCQAVGIDPDLLMRFSEQFRENIDEISYTRRLIHADLGSDNVIVKDGTVSAVIDWSGMGYGDWLHDYSRLEFWYPGRHTPAKEFAARYGLESEKFNERWLAHMAAHALSTVDFAFRYESHHTQDWLRQHLASRLGKPE